MHFSSFPMLMSQLSYLLLSSSRVPMSMDLLFSSACVKTQEFLSSRERLSFVRYGFVYVNMGPYGSEYSKR